MSNPNHGQDGRFSSGSGLRDQIKSAMSYSEAKAKKEEIEKRSKTAGSVLKSLSGGGPMGLTPDAVRATPEWQKANSDYQKAFAEERAYNEHFLKTYAKEYKADRASRRGA